MSGRDEIEKEVVRELWLAQLLLSSARALDRAKGRADGLAVGWQTELEIVGSGITSQSSYFWPSSSTNECLLSM